MVDAQSVKTSEDGAERGYDAGKADGGCANDDDASLVTWAARRWEW